MLRLHLPKSTGPGALFLDIPRCGIRRYCWPGRWWHPNEINQIRQGLPNNPAWHDYSCIINEESKEELNMVGKESTQQLNSNRQRGMRWEPQGKTETKGEQKIYGGNHTRYKKYNKQRQTRKLLPSPDPRQCVAFPEPRRISVGWPSAGSQSLSSSLSSPFQRLLATATPETLVNATVHGTRKIAHDHRGTSRRPLTAS